MKKLICVIPITILICVLLSNVKVSAVTPTNVGYIINYNPDTGVYSGTIIYYNFVQFVNDYQNKFYYAGYYGYSPYSSNLQWVINECNNVINSIDLSQQNATATTNIGTPYYIYNVPYQVGNPITPTPSATPTPTPAPSWSKTMWETLQEELSNPAFWFGEWFIDIIDQVFNNEDEPSQGPSGLSHSTHINQVTPAPTPTPIPYSTITVPRTDIINNTTVYETQYVYTSSSGDTIIATSPPTNTPSQNPTGDSVGGGSDYNPIDPYSIPEVSWFTSAEIGDTSYDGIDSIMQGFDSIDTISNNYTDGMSVAEDSMGSLPTSWLLLIGVAAAIPLIAGIISRFLS